MQPPGRTIRQVTSSEVQRDVSGAGIGNETVEALEVSNLISKDYELWSIDAELDILAGLGLPL